MKFATLLPCVLCLSAASPALVAQEEGAESSMSVMSPTGSTLTSEQERFFESRIRPALVKHCYECHSTEAEEIEGGLLLDTGESSRAGGDTGPAVTPHDLRDSLLYTAITYEDRTLEMPPKYKLDDEVIADFRRWIEMGAPDPRVRRATGAPREYTSTIDIEKGREHWAYQPPVKPAPPSGVEADDWARRPLDAFVREKHESEGLTPAPDADARTLYRRLSFDLLGLPPATAEVESFVAAHRDDPDAAVAAAVDDMLDSPQFGERWGRHWLDVARYAESAGKEVNAAFPHAWRYRDWVIDAFNEDVPFDRFVTEQLAGDLLEADSPEDRADQLVATGFLALGTKGLNERNNRQFRFDLVDEQIDTTTRAFLATTVACARCHDHKFDPIPMSDYYAMAGIFLSSETLYGTPVGIQNSHPAELVSLPAVAASGRAEKSLAEMIRLEFQLHELRERVEETLTEARELRQNGETEKAARVRTRLLGLRNRIGLAEQTLASYGDDGAPLPRAMGMRDRDEPFDSQILVRGEEDNPTRERAPRDFVQVLRTHDEEPIPADQSGRLQLARWITSPENPLTARVFVNRVWYWLFGEGLVTSLDNFGATGAEPSHPELLDYLAVRFVEMDWSVKDLVREITTSRTYRMSSEFRRDYFEKDPENRLLWRANPRRLDAESIRDASLAVSGRLDLERPMGSPVAEAGPGFIGRTVGENALEAESTHRSVYLPIVRGMVPKALSRFDFADPSLLAGKREITTVPSQALYMMNSEFVLANARAMADDLFRQRELRGSALIREAFYRCYSRPPTEEERRRTDEYVERFLATARESGMETRKARLLALTTFCQSLIASAEFRYLN